MRMRVAVIPFVDALPDRISFGDVQQSEPFVKLVSLSVDTCPLILLTGVVRVRWTVIFKELASWSLYDVGTRTQTNSNNNGMAAGFSECLWISDEEVTSRGDDGRVMWMMLWWGGLWCLWGCWRCLCLVSTLDYYPVGRKGRWKKGCLSNHPDVSCFQLSWCTE